MIETHKRSIAKALTYRFGGTVLTYFIALVLSGQTEIALGIAGFDLVIKIGWYYGHERIWQHVGWETV